jgi:lysophospholipase L1-like esterase
VLILLLGLSGVGAAAGGYLADAKPAFYFGLAVCVLAFGPGAFALGREHVPRTLLGLGLACASFAFFLLLAELALGAAAVLWPPPPLPPVLSYEEAVADPAAFQRWWTEAVRPGVAKLGRFTMPDPLGRNPYVLRPGTHQGRGPATFHVNRLGFRGPEMSRDKGEGFRIVALGESTTFDVTPFPGQRPWPELLAARIAEQLSCDRPVEVVNAGVPGWTLANQVMRFSDDIRPLAPDLILSYHGFNGFHYFFAGLPEVTLRSSTTPPPRASRIFARVEAAFRTFWFRQRYRALPEIDASVPSRDLLGSAYGDWYRRLVDAARAAGAQLVLCTFNLAVNAGSPEAAIRLHEGLVPDLRARMLANRLHTRLVSELGRSLGVPIIDTSRDLDGAYRDAFIDAAHFSQVGRERMAANVLEGLSALLRDHPRLHCRARASAGSGQRWSSQAASP